MSSSSESESAPVAPQKGKKTKKVEIEEIEQADFEVVEDGVDVRTKEKVVHRVAIDEVQLIKREQLVYWLKMKRVVLFPVYLPSFFLFYRKNVKERMKSFECIITDRSLVIRNGGYYVGALPVVGDYVPACERIVSLVEIADLSIVAPGKSMLDKRFGAWSAHVRTSSEKEGSEIAINGLQEPLLFEKELLDAMRRSPKAETRETEVLKDVRRLLVRLVDLTEKKK